MFLWHLVMAVLTALLVGAFFTLVIGRRGAWPGFIIFFLLIFLFSWAGGVWLAPFGPPISGVYWLPFLIVGIFVALILAAAAPGVPARSRGEAVREEEAAGTALGIFFWILFILLIAVIIIRYV